MSLRDKVLAGEMTLSEALDERDRIAGQGNWVPASGGTEEPFLTRSGVRVQYLYQPSTGCHAYINVETDVIIPDDELDNYFSMR